MRIPPYPAGNCRLSLSITLRRLVANVHGTQNLEELWECLKIQRTIKGSNIQWQSRTYHVGNSPNEMLLGRSLSLLFLFRLIIVSAATCVELWQYHVHPFFCSVTIRWKEKNPLVEWSSVVICDRIALWLRKQIQKKWRKKSAAEEKKRNSRFLWLFFFPVAVHLPLSSTPSTTQIVKKDPRAEWLLSLLPFLFPDVRTIQFFFERNTEDFNRASFQYNPTILLIISSSTRVLYRNISALLLLHFNCSGEILWKISTRDFIRFLGCRQIF